MYNVCSVHVWLHISLLDRPLHMSYPVFSAFQSWVRRTLTAQQEAIDELLRLTRTLVAQQPETESDFVADGPVKTDEDVKQLDEKLGNKEYRRQMVCEYTVTHYHLPSDTLVLKFHTSRKCVLTAHLGLPRHRGCKMLCCCCCSEYKYKILDYVKSGRDSYEM